MTSHELQPTPDNTPWADEVRALVERTCAEQGVPVKVTDRATVERVAALLRADTEGRRKRAATSVADDS